MLDPSEQQRRLSAQLTLFKDRLLDLDTRNPSLLLRKEVQSRSFDLAKLGAAVLESSYTRLLGGTASIPLVLNRDESPGAIQMRRPLQQPSRASKGREEETGLRELYVGFCWLTGHAEARTFLRGPLLLVPARITRSTTAHCRSQQTSIAALPRRPSRGFQ